MEQQAAIAALSALAHTGRLDIYRLLVRAGHTGRAAGAIGDALGIPPSTLSFHLSQLQQAELVTHERDGRSLIYSARFPTIANLLAYITENCCQGDTQGDTDRCSTSSVAGDACCEPVTLHSTHSEASHVQV